MTKLRILHIVHRGYPPCFGGLSRYADKICQLHAKRGHMIEAWTTLEDTGPRVENREGYLVRRYSAPFWLFENPFTLSMLPSLLRHSDFDLIVAHSHLMFTTAFATAKSLISSVPLVLISHGYAIQRGALFGVAQSTYTASVSRAIAKEAKHVVALTNREAERFVDLGVRRENCAVIPPGVNSTLFRPSQVQHHEDKRIVWTGRFVPEKNLACLIKATALLKRRIPDVKLVLAGEGPERAQLMELSRTLGVDAKFPGLLTSQQIIELLQSAALYALPSMAEAFPIALLEALACGLPSVVSSGLGLEQIVDGAGLIADRSDLQDWTHKLETILTNNELRKDMSARARELAVTHYDWNTIADRLERLFISVAEQSNAVFP